MKKSIIFRITAIILSAAICFSLAACSLKFGIVENVKVELGDSERFSQQELEDAVKSVKNYFKTDFGGCELISICYDEYSSDCEIESYLNNGPGAYNGSTYENTIVLYSDFITHDPSYESGLEHNTDYEGWKWTLIRNKRGGSWRVDECGY